MKISRSIISMAACLAMIAPAQAVELDFSYNTSDEEAMPYGFSKVETYDVAIRLTDRSLVGKKVVGLYVEAGAVGTSGHTAWLSRELKLEKKVNKPDVLSKAGTVGEDGYLRVTFDDPYTITEDGIYVGYSLTVDELLDEWDAYPIAVVEGVNEEGLYLHTSRSRMKWSAYSSRLGGVSAMTVVLEGDFKPNDAGVMMADVVYSPVGEASAIDATIINHGSEPVSSISYSYSSAGVTGSGEVTLKEPIRASFGVKGSVRLPISAFPELGEFPFTLTIDKVNGAPNEDTGRSYDATMEVLPFVPVSRPLVEEYTGMWCGYCPVGYIALETLRNKYSGEFIAAAYHNEDVLSTVPEEFYPSYIEGFPSSFVNRGFDEVYPGDLTAVWPVLRKALAPAEVNVSVAWADGAKTKLSATATARFVRDMNGADLKMGYILVADSLSDPSWEQSNYLSGDESLEGEFADLFINGGDKVAGLIYNDVVLSPEGLAGVDASIPEDIKAGTSYSHSFTFDLNGVLNLEGATVVQNPGTLRVIAFVLDTYEGVVLNSNSSDYASGEAFSGLESVSMSAAAGVVATEFYDLRGIRVEKPVAGGLYIKSEKMSDGSRRVSKIINK